MRLWIDKLIAAFGLASLIYLGLIVGCLAVLAIIGWHPWWILLVAATLCAEGARRLSRR